MFVVFYCLRCILYRKLYRVQASVHKSSSLINGVEFNLFDELAKAWFGLVSHDCFDGFIYIFKSLCGILFVPFK